MEQSLSTAIIEANTQHEQVESTSQPFIEANTIDASVHEIRENHIIPVFVKDNETLISHSDFIETTMATVEEVFAGEKILLPSVRLSHPVKGRIPEAKGKPVHQLEEWEKTIYYERMAFIIEIPGISDIVNGNDLTLTIGGVKSYSLDNLYNKKGADEHFKVFVGFKNRVCTNLCVWTDGALLDLKVKNIGQLKGSIKTMLLQYNLSYHIHHLKELGEYAITEQQFAQIVGRCRMYPLLPTAVKNEIPQLLFNDTQMNTIVRDYYKDNSFCKDTNGNLNLWRLYNLFTGANKSTYIDQFLERGVNAFSFIYSLKSALQAKDYHWYLG